MRQQEAAKVIVVDHPERLYEDADRVMFSQLANSSKRWTEPGALADAQDAYGTNCETPFTRIWFDMISTSKVFCSKLVWRIYLDKEDYSVNLDSNHWIYYLWLEGRYPTQLASTILFSSVAPDEIALSSHLEDYRTLDLD